jgi:hemerythrin-like domain-containing protein
VSTEVDPVRNMNSVIHRALRRDLDRLETVTRDGMPDAQRAALCRHVGWMLDFLHHHHVGEDDGVWPRLLAKRPDLAPLVEEMGAEHAALAAASDRLREAADAYALDGSAGTRERLHGATVAMQEATLPHLDHEEREVIPLAVETFDADDWAYLSRNHFRKGLSFTDSGMSLMWDLDDLDPAYAAAVRSELPGPVLWLMTLVFGSRYDREAATRWGPLAGTRT